MIINIYNKNITIKNVNYLAIIIYFKNLIKYLNAKEIINIIKITLLDNCFKNNMKKLKI